ncbi:MAG: hypothetical protein SF053_07435 [Bacteroidia bacterium]|nr:hypothetical protein [Bacteroidia bacterium]
MGTDSGIQDWIGLLYADRRLIDRLYAVRHTQGLPLSAVLPLTEEARLQRLETQGIVHQYGGYWVLNPTLARWLAVFHEGEDTLPLQALAAALEIFSRIDQTLDTGQPDLPGAIVAGRNLVDALHQLTFGLDARQLRLASAPPSAYAHPDTLQAEVRELTTLLEAVRQAEYASHLRVAGMDTASQVSMALFDAWEKARVAAGRYIARLNTARTTADATDRFQYRLDQVRAHAADPALEAALAAWPWPLALDEPLSLKPRLMLSWIVGDEAQPLLRRHVLRAANPAAAPPSGIPAPEIITVSGSASLLQAFLAQSEDLLTFLLAHHAADMPPVTTVQQQYVYLAGVAGNQVQVTERWRSWEGYEFAEILPVKNTPQ